MGSGLHPAHVLLPRTPLPHAPVHLVPRYAHTRPPCSPTPGAGLCSSPRDPQVVPPPANGPATAGGLSLSPHAHAPAHGYSRASACARGSPGVGPAPRARRRQGRTVPTSVHRSSPPATHARRKSCIQSSCTSARGASDDNAAEPATNRTTHPPARAEATASQLQPIAWWMRYEMHYWPHTLCQGPIRCSALLSATSRTAPACRRADSAPYLSATRASSQ